MEITLVNGNILVTRDSQNSNAHVANLPNATLFAKVQCSPYVQACVSAVWRFETTPRTA